MSAESTEGQRAAQKRLMVCSSYPRILVATDSREPAAAFLARYIEPSGKFCRTTYSPETTNPSTQRKSTRMMESTRAPDTEWEPKTIFCILPPAEHDRVSRESRFTALKDMAQYTRLILTGTICARDDAGHWTQLENGDSLLSHSDGRKSSVMRLESSRVKLGPVPSDPRLRRAHISFDTGKGTRTDWTNNCAVEGMLVDTFSDGVTVLEVWNVVKPAEYHQQSSQTEAGQIADDRTTFIAGLLEPDMF